MARKKAKEVTLAEHVARIGRLGGIATAASLSAEEKSEIGRKAGLVGGRARADKLTAKQRKAIAKKAAEARWGEERKKQK